MEKGGAAPALPCSDGLAGLREHASIPAFDLCDHAACLSLSPLSSTATPSLALFQSVSVSEFVVVAPFS
jgi:hypothetical protein